MINKIIVKVQFLLMNMVYFGVNYNYNFYIYTVESL